ncbi:unnamed protein product [Paramecium primaurelia]|uniref:Uncharacterized protein n=1 Tax=Paramecium primaurelia TaxID=5886 RepID=A0A8S1NTW3_PARPR|nr:unnamed protein product [Paramecium primaurelia]
MFYYPINIYKTMKKPLYLSDLIYFILSIGNIIQLLLLQNRPLLTIVLMTITLGMLIIYLFIKIYYYSTDDSSIILLMLNTIIIIIRIIAINNVQQIIYQTDMYCISSYQFFLIASHLYHTKFKSQIQVYISNYLYNIISIIGSKFLQNYFIINYLSLNDIKQVNKFILFSRTIVNKNPETPKKILKQSHTWHNNQNYIDNQLKTDLNIKYISSQPNMHIQCDSLIKEDTIDNLKRVQELFHLPFIITDKDAKPILYNSYFMDAFEKIDQKNIQYGIKNIKINRLDKNSQKIVKKFYYEKQMNQNIYIRSSSQPNTYPLLSISSQPIKLLLNHILQIMNAQYFQCSVIDFQSEYLKSIYQIDIKFIQGYFLFIFTQTQERDDYKNKINTKLLMNQLFRSLSHEFSTSLNCIQILAENALEELQENTVNKYIQPLLNSCYILNSIVQDVKDFSLILSKNFTLTIKNTNICKLINEVTALFQSQIQMKGLKINIITNNISIHTDAQRVKQSLINLLSNAQKFTFQGSIAIIATEEIINNIKYVKISVEDTGPGMDNETQIKLSQFLKSSQKGRYKDQNQSFGMGLLITQKIVKGLSLNHEGGIHFESNVQQGSKFWFLVQDLNQEELPNQNSKQTIRYNKINSSQSNSRYDISQPVSPSIKDLKRQFSPLLSHRFTKDGQNLLLNQSSSISQSENISFQEEKFDCIINPYIMKQGCQKPLIQIDINEGTSISTKILIVDDEFVNIYALKIMLNRLNYLCDVANNGYEALDKFMQNQYQLIFMDIEMPNMNGITATKQILQFCEQNDLQKPIIIAQTAYTDSLTKTFCYESGMSYFLQKPIHTKDIKQILDEKL